MEGISMLKQITEVIEKDVRPYLESHGGGIEVLKITEDNDVVVRLTGACSGCPASQATMEHLVTSALKAKVPAVNQVIVDGQLVSQELLDIALDILKGGNGGLDKPRH
jgi:Fe-S cluster biogenesis protein NfuA